MQMRPNRVDFIEYLSNFDVILLCETWSRFSGEFDNLLSHFNHFDKVRTQKPSAIRNSGGFSVFISSRVADLGLCHRICDQWSDCIVLLLRLSLLYDAKDLILFFVYISPEGSTIYESGSEPNGILIMQECVDELKHKYPTTDIVIAGDLNARTKDFADFIYDDDISFI